MLPPDRHKALTMPIEDSCIPKNLSFSCRVFNLTRHILTECLTYFVRDPGTRGNLENGFSSYPGQLCTCYDQLPCYLGPIVPDSCKARYVALYLR